MKHLAATALPLLSHTSPADIVARRHDGAVTVGRFLADVRHLAARLPAGGHVLNVCADRYRFTVGLAAGLITKKISLLPSTHTPETVRQLLAFAPDTFCLTDNPACDIGLPQHQYREFDAEADEGPIPLIDAEQTVAYVFTSGSTGTPVPHRKTWGALVRNIAAEADRLGFSGGCTVIGTVPPQHMYGFESTVLLPMLSGGIIWSGRPFYPADIADALLTVARPRILVSTPFHLRTLVAAGIDVPPADLAVSATAPLSGNLASAVEAQLCCPLLEIYGCTETGQTAMRRTAETAEWRLLRELRLSVEDGKAWVEGGHVELRTPLGDIIEPTAGDRFLLHGRSADLVNIAGKRSSLGYLNHHLNAIPGVIDGSFLMPADEQADGVTRLAAVVVAPELDHATLLRALRERIDPIFLPRPLIFVDRLPRNATGKLPREALEELVRQPDGTA